VRSCEAAGFRMRSKLLSPVYNFTLSSEWSVELVWNLMAHGDAQGGEVKGKLANGVCSQCSHTTSEGGVSSITNADVHISAASSRLNWRPRWFKLTRPFRRKTKSGFCACAITFQTHCTFPCIHSSSMLLWGGRRQVLLLTYSFFCRMVENLCGFAT
jgi:hypothetical protein